MSKSSNQLKTVRLRLSTTTAVVGYLQELVATGLYGRHHTEAAERLISQGIEKLIHQGTLRISTTENQVRSSKRVEND
jgi:hypothetical protein